MKPVILDTDIGSDIDDTWALALLLKSPELDLRLVTVVSGDTAHRAALAAKMLTIGGRTDVPIGIGLGSPADFDIWPQMEWVADYNLDTYAGRVESDGVEAMIRTIMDSPETIDVIAIGPLTNIAAAASREPRILEKTRIVGMQGSLRRGYGGSKIPVPEYNIRFDVAAAKAVFAAPWTISITPLDTCGLVVLEAEKYRAVLESADPLTRAVVENYRLWCVPRGHPRTQAEERSSVLYDTVAITMAFSEKHLVMEPVKLVVTDDGRTVADNLGKDVRCATEWTDLPAFEDFLVQRLTKF